MKNNYAYSFCLCLYQGLMGKVTVQIKRKNHALPWLLSLQLVHTHIKRLDVKAWGQKYTLWNSNNRITHFFGSWVLHTTRRVAHKPMRKQWTMLFILIWTWRKILPYAWIHVAKYACFRDGTRNTCYFDKSAEMRRNPWNRKKLSSTAMVARLIAPMGWWNPHLDFPRGLRSEQWSRNLFTPPRRCFSYCRPLAWYLQY